jgi:hypothetical protein
MTTQTNYLLVALALALSAGLLGFYFPQYLNNISKEKAFLDHTVYMDGVSDGFNNGLVFGSMGYSSCLHGLRGIYLCNESTLLVLDENYNTTWSTQINSSIDITPGGTVLIHGDDGYYLTGVK